MKGVYGIGELPQEVVDYVELYLIKKGYNSLDISNAWSIMDRNELPLCSVNPELSSDIESAIASFRNQFPDFYLMDIDAEDVFMETTL